MACKLIIVSGMAFEAKIARAPGICTLYGLNPAKLGNDIETAIRDGASGLLSFGTAAGIAPNLSPGAIIIARRVVHQNQLWEADAEWAARLRTALPAAHHADIAGVDNALSTTQEKAALSAQAAIADMESHQVARIASQYQLPFAAIRVVLDDARCTLPPAALVSMRADGTVNYAALLYSLLAHPGQLPALLQLAASSSKAKQSLVYCGKLLRGGFFAMDAG